MAQRPNYWKILKEAGIDRPYKLSDMEAFLGVALTPEVAYKVDFHKQFVADLGRCEKHPYPYLWHKNKSESCPACSGSQN